MELSHLYEEFYYKELNQDSYYLHDENIEPNNNFDLKFWKNIFYFIEIQDLRMIYNNSSIRILFDFM
jgi:hypothetical protein